MPMRPPTIGAHSELLIWYVEVHGRWRATPPLTHPLTARLAPDLVTLWCRTAGLDVVSYLRQSDEQYMLTVQHSEKQEAI